jgi:hypothetical protein
MNSLKFCLYFWFYHHHHHHHQWQNSPFWAIAFLTWFCQIAFGFHVFGFRNNILFYRARSSALRATSKLEDLVPVFMSHNDRVAQFYTQTPRSLFVAFYDSQGYGGAILTRPHTGIYEFIADAKKRVSCIIQAHISQLRKTLHGSCLFCDIHNNNSDTKF